MGEQQRRVHGGSKDQEGAKHPDAFAVRLGKLRPGTEQRLSQSHKSQACLSQAPSLPSPNLCVSVSNSLAPSPSPPLTPVLGRKLGDTHCPLCPPTPGPRLPPQELNESPAWPPELALCSAHGGGCGGRG